ncbi:hypothetical protein IQ244_02660 [Nostoc sp. LEGE 06077]|uniref:hypothetical protein n=1 Tax=Nostoc sp. LEGE 06077 TaxID=915325 RepID=UPI00187F8539|nr:hypothetical protein [Nostoc sp. LEGE 06077]MBE9205450.1 hypothetical protein [Nostoc sp. LEGE 06077]
MSTDRIGNIVNKQNDPLRPSREINHHITSHIDAAIWQGMSINANDRPESIHKWLDLLEPSSQNPPNTSFWIKLWNSWDRLGLDKKIAILTVVALILGSVGSFLQGIGGIAPIFKPSTTSSPVASPSKSP